ncbi:hypothetical protein VVMO6_02373 [Vibrio vulnificus MO6-24/O]|nr:hypothetical protein VVMO6_02373 [Vibrio vulnificus MO6-24/O]
MASGVLDHNYLRLAIGSLIKKPPEKLSSGLFSITLFQSD